MNGQQEQPGPLKEFPVKGSRLEAEKGTPEEGEKNPFEQIQAGEKPPAWFQRYIEDLEKAIFDPKNFESPELYEKLGVRAFKRYLPWPSGDIVSRLIWKKLQTDGTPKSLDDLLANTKMLETTHYFIFAAFSVVSGYLLARGQIGGAAVFGIANIFANVYPILVQRFNRSRIQKLKEKREDGAESVL